MPLARRGTQSGRPAPPMGSSLGKGVAGSYLFPQRARTRTSIRSCPPRRARLQQVRPRGENRRVPRKDLRNGLSARSLASILCPHHDSGLPPLSTNRSNDRQRATHRQGPGSARSRGPRWAARTVFPRRHGAQALAPECHRRLLRSRCDATRLLEARSGQASVRARWGRMAG